MSFFKTQRAKGDQQKVLETECSVECFVVSRISNSLILGTTDGKVIVYDMSTYEKKREVQFFGFPTGVLAKQKIIGVLKSQGRDEAVKEVERFEKDGEFQMGEATNYFNIDIENDMRTTGSIKCMCLIHDEKIGIGFNNSVSVFDLKQMGDLVVITEDMKGHEGMVRKLETVNNKIVSLGNDKLICIWGKDGKLEKKIERTDEDYYYNASLVVGCDLLVSGSRLTPYIIEKGTMTRVFEVSLYTIPYKDDKAMFMQHLHHNRISPHNGVIITITRLGNGNILTGSQDGVFAVWDGTKFFCLFIKINSSQMDYLKMKQNCPVHCADFMAIFDTGSNYRETTPTRRPMEDKYTMPFGKYRGDVTDMFVVTKEEGKSVVYVVIGETGEVHVINFDTKTKPLVLKTHHLEGKIIATYQDEKQLILYPLKASL
ncbi:hypothetical protein EIN_318620 [Entamoeba invadens IP1]|uniref:Uncharacterized protein n=1 Tax=Entamoeba invadens IP1 TaxID=370355 RepID=A0A0A1U2W0_ENTIV|nr:hypothetical protein EIN_318620 [Entamoeba invadens IP1]ELP87003.1 hypothetical protein EIN_318620 [Entamoeba invadens IP1]|eukprot:XP_004253774.1 hypothetical protein EIN_318620 [Entamoeba invadens IP1]